MYNNTMVKGILFDMDGTLTDRRASAYDCYCACVEQMCDYDPLTQERIVQELMIWDQYGYVNKREVWEKLRDKHFPTLDIDYWTKYWYDNFHRYQRLMPSCLEVLDDLHKDYKLGIVTNGAHESQMAKVKSLGLHEHVDIVVTEGGFGMGKPDSGIFVHACSLLGLLGKETAFVGDMFPTDIYGAMAAECHPIWMCHDQRIVSNYAIKTICGLKELRGVLEELL